MWKYAVLLSYLGTRYCGWQRQKAIQSGPLPSIQTTVDGAIKHIAQEEVSLVGSGRTDAGVHAVGQVAHFTLRSKEWETRVLQKALNSVLPSDIRVLGVRNVPLDFHAQRSATKKQYSYYFQQGPAALPHFEPLSWWIRKPLNLKAMSDAVADLKGIHNFKPFQASGAKPARKPEQTTREILEAEVTFIPIGFPPHLEIWPIPEKCVGLVRLRITGTGFLKQMVRGIAGTLLQVGEGRRDSNCFREILRTGNRSAVGPTAPARALWLEQVWYPERYALF